MHDQDDGYDWGALARQLAGLTGVAEKIRAQHVPDHTGHCVRCRQLQVRHEALIFRTEVKQLRLRPVTAGR